MSVIQDIQGACSPEGKLRLRWDIYCDAVGLLVEIGTSADMKANYRQFLIPVIKSCELDVGSGDWFVRICCLVGDKKKGQLEQSGTYGPFPVVSKKGLVPLGKTSDKKIAHVQPIQEGMRFHTGYVGEYWVLWETSKDGKRIMKYSHDWGQGYFDAGGLDAGKMYNFERWLVDECVCVEEKIVTLGAPIVIGNKKVLERVKFRDFTDSVQSKADKAILTDLAGSRRVQFGDYRQYAAYLAAKERARDAIRNV